LTSKSAALQGYRFPKKFDDFSEEDFKAMRILSQPYIEFHADQKGSHGNFFDQYNKMSRDGNNELLI